MNAMNMPLGGQETTTGPLVKMKGITKEYHGVPAVKNVDFTLERGEVHALLGENGAGKSTLTKMLSGVTNPTHGVIEVDGKEVRIGSPSDARDLGIVMVYQETSLVSSMSVGQNLFLGDEARFNKLRDLYIQAQVILHSLNFDVNPWDQVDTLGAAQKQMVEIARAVRQNARVIIFDEPTATLTPEERAHFFSLIGRLRNQGVTIVFITHALEEALNVSDRITILRDGEIVTSDVTSNFTQDSIVRDMVGRDLTEELYGHVEKREARQAKGEVLSVENLSLGSIVRNNSFTIYGGQITGFFGLVGSGRTEAAKIVSGVLKRNFFHGGTVRLGGKPVRYRVPLQAMRDGIVYVTEDRKIEGFFETMSIGENLHIADLAASPEKGSVIRMSEAKELFKVWKEKLSIRAMSAEAKVLELSGGNQQKVVIAKSLLQKPKLIIFDEPTRGVDVGAIAEIHKIINELADSGMAVVVISSYLPEIQHLSDRILVNRGGRVVAEFPRGATDDEIMFASVH
ncbi:sugar ABC transporter ATP-binding protein [Celeribacter litoreus]|uniref:sugar ABC transporter ATP-binding protein n=1 Tax=Celeribacter litoreus TaxID=2876714 RepID=UPI001CCC1128|nr:sugar ABC transporter ATP-binding protein [Celeribacter litoreus]MCA0043405.1 sugar ABC transporter ATP-binding protein [Celeribacter litoreus]